MSRPRLPRLPLALALLAALAAPACKKAPTAGTDGPGAGTTPAGSGLLLRYKPGPARLKETLTASFVASGGGGGGEMKADVTGLLEISDAAPGKLKVAFSVTEVRSFELLGGMKPEAKDGQPVPDLKAKLLAARGARVVDLLGDADKDATKALPENAPKKQGEEDPFDMSSFGSFLGLPPELPKEPLAEGTPLKVKKEEKESLFGALEIDMETETTYTLVKIDSSSGKRVAEIKIDSESSGANEISQGGKSTMVSLDVTSEGTIWFNLDDQIPVRSHLEATQAFSAGPQGGDFRIVLDSSYEPA
jgi:hypothetical protein